MGRAAWRRCCPDGITGLRRALYVAFGWFFGAQLFAVTVGSPPDRLLAPTVGLMEVAFVLINVPTALEAWSNLRAAKRARDAVVRRGGNGLLLERASACVRLQRLVGWMATVFLLLGARALSLPSPPPQADLGSVSVLNLLISLALAGAYVSIVERVERQREWGQVGELVEGNDLLPA